MPFRFTPLMKKRLNRRTQFMLQAALRLFPELHGKVITVGYTRAHLGSALIPRDREAELTIRLKVRKLSYNTIGHELTHLVQGLSHLNSDGADGRIPSGEKQCDIWTLARSELFCDQAPTYLKLPAVIRANWPSYAGSVRTLCVAAIAKRATHRLYIRWLEEEIQRLAHQNLAQTARGVQMHLEIEEPCGSL
ncbi:MAG: hypothetical protein ONB46_04350 [candidate division KSB1 bacterium]|nr:hypothetical protein [candidate division KSB1 bacterium]MDZ7365149.1 hypothetical protein [candidate division KSB1 bacterium]MDZ7404359.1 hypothetical protein [candidate division KSB1 bacterium]